jgi:CD109 antigen
MRRLKVSASLVAVALVLALFAGCTSPPPTTESTEAGRVDGYVALVPDVLRAGETAAFSFTLFDGDEPGRSHVDVKVRETTGQGRVIAEGTAFIEGKGTVGLDVPAVSSGDYLVELRGTGFADTAKVRIEPGTLVFLETDKPIYKPGQSVLMRVIALDSELKPVKTRALVEVQDAKGVKVFKKEVSTDEYGMATATLPLSAEPNLGVWKLSVSAGGASSDLDVRVEEYVLPKYEVKAALAKDWFLVDEPLTGRVTAQYSFGRPVKGQLKVTASRYVGEWEQYATYEGPIDATAEFRIKAPGYVAGVPEAGGLGNVRLDISVVEQSTGYQQTTTELVTVAATPVNIKLIPESSAFKPGLPFGLLLVTETPGGEPVEAAVSVDVTYTDEFYGELRRERTTVETVRGTGLVRITPPKKAIRMIVYATSGDAASSKEMTAAHSPSGNFIHVQQRGPTTLEVGDKAEFTVVSTAEAGTFYYEVVARGRVVFTGSAGRTISFRVTPAMAPSARLLVYQILPSSEVAADAIPFDVRGEYPQEVTVTAASEEVAPGDGVEVDIRTEGRAKVGLVAVDRSVYILAENRLNLEQVFAELERLYMQPQAELHEVEWMMTSLVVPGAEETFRDAGLIVLSNKKVPAGIELEQPQMMFEGDLAGGIPKAAQSNTETTAAAGARPPAGQSGGLAEVQRVRQFFPETWIWEEALTDDDGRVTLEFAAPDSITTWDIRAVAVSPDKGLGIGETSLRVFQPFFLQADLPYSAVRGEEFPVKIALYNYLPTPQRIQVDLGQEPWFDLLGGSTLTVTVAGNDVGSAEFRIRPRSIGDQVLKVTARSSAAADAVNKGVVIVPEGVGREWVENAVVPAGQARTLNLLLPPTGLVPDSARAYVAVTGSLLAQSIEGLDGLLQMPFGCGEQNMILFAPDAFILKYLEQTGQLKPEIQAKAEMLLITGYQRELTYRRADGSFSAFGDQDEQGSLWLTAFVLKTFAQAKDLTFIDPAVLADASRWITSRQEADGSFEAVGFVHHQEMVGGVQGKDALTAYVTIALLEAGQSGAAQKAVSYLEGRLEATNDPYGLALVTYALELGGSDRREEALQKLLAAAISDDEGLHWSTGRGEPRPYDQGAGGQAAPQVAPPAGEMPPIDTMPILDVEATGYGTLALLAGGDRLNAAEAAKWLAGRRNSQGGFGSTQDTVVALQALTEYAAASATDTDLTVTVTAGSVRKTIDVDPANFDVTQVIAVPAGVPVQVRAEGKGEALLQGVLRYNLAEAEQMGSVFDISVDYGTEQVVVDDRVEVGVAIAFHPPEPVKAGMVVLDVSVPTGFAAVAESLDRLLEEPKIKRYDTAGRKVIVYIEDMSPGETLSFSFQAQALYPVRAKAGVSSVYAYYTPEWRGETLAGALAVR